MEGEVGGGEVRGVLMLAMKRLFLYFVLCVWVRRLVFYCGTSGMGGKGVIGGFFPFFVEWACWGLCGEKVEFGRSLI